ncbi:MAG: P-loop NTPase [Dehalococcoidia bacterium]
MSEGKIPLCVFSLKGGVGKTTMACAITRGLQERGHQVAFLDADYNNPVAHLLLGIPHQRHKPLPDYGIAPVAHDGFQFASIAFLFSPTGTSKQATSARARVLEELCTTLRWQPHDFLVIDTAPSSSEENRTILRTLDPAVVIVAEPGILSERGLERGVRFLKATGAQVLGLLGNKGYDPSRAASALGVPVLGTVPFTERPTVSVERLLGSQPIRLGGPSLVQKGKRSILRTGLEAYVKVKEWRR